MSTRDCSSKDGNLGCDGGNAVNAFRWTDQNGGICTEASYNYTAGPAGKTGSCHTGCSKVLSIKGASGVARSNESALVEAIAINPVAVAIDASAIQNYRSSIFPAAHCGDNLNHNVLAVGFDTAGAKPYFIGTQKLCLPHNTVRNIFLRLCHYS